MILPQCVHPLSGCGQWVISGIFLVLTQKIFLYVSDQFRQEFWYAWCECSTVGDEGRFSKGLAWFVSQRAIY